MITYEPFWKTLKQKNISQYMLITEYQVSTSLLNRLRKNLHISTHTIDQLCSILHCNVEDIVQSVHDIADDNK